MSHPLFSQRHQPVTGRLRTFLACSVCLSLAYGCSDDSTSNLTEPTTAPPNATEATNTTATTRQINAATTFRLDSFALVDPHLYLGAFFDCIDITDTGMFGIDSINTFLQKSLEDGDIEVELAVNPMPEQAASGQMQLGVQSDGCDDDNCGLGPVMTSYQEASTGSCAEIDPNALNPAYTRPHTAPAPCLASSATELTIPLIEGLLLRLQTATVSATVTEAGLAQGLIRGFLSESDAKNQRLPDDLDFVGGNSLWQFLAGPDSDSACSQLPSRPVNDSDTHVVAGQNRRGFWMHFNFTAVKAS